MSWRRRSSGSRRSSRQRTTSGHVTCGRPRSRTPWIWRGYPGFGGHGLVARHDSQGRRSSSRGSRRLTRIRRAGAGGLALKKTQRALERLVDPLTRGDRMSPCGGLARAERSSASALAEDGWHVSSPPWGHLLNGLGHRLQAVQKTRGGSHPDRNAQFEYINATADGYLQRKQPVIRSTPKKELVGDFRNGGQEWPPKGTPEQVQVHDFPDGAVPRPSRTESTTWPATRRGSASAASTSPVCGRLDPSTVKR